MKFLLPTAGLLALLVSTSLLADTPRPKPERFAKEIAAFAKQEPEKGGIVFTGSSSIRLWTKLKKDFRNPLIPNFKNQRAVDLTSDPSLKAELLKYMEFQADARAMEWYGPVFRQRVFTMLLVLKRLAS